jgi:Zn-dependent M28 family amino/carboxypeptidase
MKKSPIIFMFAFSLILFCTVTLFGKEDGRKIDSSRIKRHLEVLTATPEFRNYRNVISLNICAEYILKEFEKIGLETSVQEFTAVKNVYKNIIGTAGDSRNKTVVIGAHYDVCGDQEGADDNASGVAGLIELARAVKSREKELNYYVIFAAYALEEPPFFRTEKMGSYVHARALHEKKAEIELMISLEMIGYFSDKRGSQKYPLPFMELFYPDKGNYISVVSDMNSKKYLEPIKNAFLTASKIPCETLASPSFIRGLDSSDHRSFWKFGYKAVMITDTAYYRNHDYHRTTDTLDKIDPEKIAEVVKGLAAFILD